MLVSMLCNDMWVDDVVCDVDHVAPHTSRHDRADEEVTLLVPIEASRVAS